MHTLMWVVGGLVALGIFVLAAVLLGRSIAEGARVFIWPGSLASLVNMLLGVYWANVTLQRRDSRARGGIRRAGGGGLVCGAPIRRRRLVNLALKSRINASAPR